MIRIALVKCYACRHSFFLFGSGVCPRCGA